MKPTKKSYDIDSCSRPNEKTKSPALRKSKYYYINTASFWHHNICGSTYPSMAASKENKLSPSFSGFKSHKFLHESIFGCSKRSPDFITAVYSMLPGIRMVPVSRQLKQKLNFWGALFSYRWTRYFEWKLNISAFRWRFWGVESFRNSRRRGRSVQVNKHFMANIYAVYCAVKLVLLRKG